MADEDAPSSTPEATAGVAQYLESLCARAYLVVYGFLLVSYVFVLMYMAEHPAMPTPETPQSPKATLRQKIEAHRNDANCAACHAKIDPLGLAWDNYDAIGQWRTVERTMRGNSANLELAGLTRAGPWRRSPKETRPCRGRYSRTAEGAEP